ncbi:alkaline phosphatase D family protein [Pseudomonas sp. dw_612]|uniref:alkaline phosphatase D family protein n=1 Tax=Pseudomonas sp. dw_612 TaxID=2720080 RepID=UPI001BD33F02|nr:alkaline phosphatase D family protein [Pseudomonas sp. dw_612]
MAITLGPIIGHTTDVSAKIWIRGESNEDSHFCIGLVDVYKDATWVASYRCFLRDYYDFTGAIDVVGLKAGTTYRVVCNTAYIADELEVVRLIRDDTPKKPLNRPEDSVLGTLTTDRQSNDGKLNFAFGSCRYLYWDNIFQSDAEKGDKTFRSILDKHAQKPFDLTLMIGDQVYLDPLNVLRQYSTLDEMFGIYRQAFGLPYIRKLMSQVPTYMILDDHEIRDDWSREKLDDVGKGFYVSAMRGYESYQHLHNPATPKGQYWYTFKKGAFPFFVMDTRTLRISKPTSIESPTILGREQLNAFLTWLSENRNAPMIFVVSSVPFFPDPKSGGDKWAGFPEERSIILEFIRVEKIKNVVVLSGDVHNSCFAGMSCYQDADFGLTSLVASPFYWPYPHENKSNFFGGRTLEFMQWSDATRRERDRVEYRYEGEAFIGEESFMTVTVDASKKGKIAQARIFDRKGQSPDDYPGFYKF